MADPQSVRLRPTSDTPATDRRDKAIRASLSSRVRSEFQELPGTCLSAAQASRLFGLPADATARILRQLLREGVLELTRHGQYRLRSAAA